MKRVTGEQEMKKILDSPVLGPHTSWYHRIIKLEETPKIIESNLWFLRFSVDTSLHDDRERSYNFSDFCKYLKVDIIENLALQMSAISRTNQFLFLLQPAPRTHLEFLT